jgi:hypothetical protein
MKIEDKYLKELELNEIENDAMNFVFKDFYKTYLEQLKLGIYIDTKTNMPIYEAINEIETYDFINLFETALFIGNRTDNILGFLSQSTETFTKAILEKTLAPRTPTSRIKYSQAPKELIVIAGKATRIKKIPDMTWELSLKEAAEFATTLYPNEYFEDLLDNEEKTKKNKPEIKEESKASVRTNDDMTFSERELFLKTIGLLVHTLADTSPNNFRKAGDVEGALVYGGGEKGKAIVVTMLKKLAKLAEDNNIHGLSKTNIIKALKLGDTALKNEI